MWVGAALLCACGMDEGQPVAGSTGSTGSTSTNPDTTDPPQADSSTSGSDASTAPETSSPTPETSSESSESSDTDDPENACDLLTDFEGLPDGSPWPVPWVVTGGVAIADVVEGRGRLVPETSPYALARVFAPLPCDEVEGTLTFELGDDTTQGIGFYVQHNGGHLDTTDPPGAGYSAFAESFRDPAGLGTWRELNGHEQLLSEVTPVDLQPGVPYRMRVRLTRDADTTLIQARVWPAQDPEPNTWHSETTDNEPALQTPQGGIVLDAWSSLQSGPATDLYIDNVEIHAL